MLRILIVSLFVFAATMAVPDRWVPGGDVQVSVLSEEKANELFKEFVSHKEIIYEYAVDGCYARANAMSIIAEEENIEMGKVFAEGDIFYDTKDPKYRVVNWGFHVAPIALIKGSDGKIQKMVFDPSMFDKPVPVDEWLAKMKLNPRTKINEAYYGSRFQVEPQSARNTKVHQWQNGVKAETKETLEAIALTVQPGYSSHFEKYIFQKAREKAALKKKGGVQ
ncbi:protein-glutamine glutaminase family protein [Bdellovibrio sp. HCB185ZH]|uniref:protein-glutamine glutaminase family protein n=1 Tax=Bdellovibrio sp. HCB185ZH TaxID=3394235 RepID=UPI0039A731DD